MMAELTIGSVNLSTVKEVHLSVNEKGDLKLEVTAIALNDEGETINHRFEINLMGSAMKPFHKQDKVYITCNEKFRGSINTAD